MSSAPPNVVDQLDGGQLDSGGNAAATPNQHMATGPSSFASQEYERVAVEAAAEQQEMREQAEKDRREVVWPAFVAWRKRLGSRDPPRWIAGAPVIGAEVFSVAGGVYMFVQSRERPVADLVGRTVLGVLMGGVGGLVAGTAVQHLGFVLRSGTVQMPEAMPLEVETALHKQLGQVSLNRMMAMRQSWAELVAANSPSAQQQAAPPWLPVATTVATALVK